MAPFALSYYLFLDVFPPRTPFESFKKAQKVSAHLRQVAVEGWQTEFVGTVSRFKGGAGVSSFES